jgi:hypothetical protein
VLVFVVLLLLSACVHVERPDYPTAWPQTVDSSQLNCESISGTYANSPIGTIPDTKEPILLSELISLPAESEKVPTPETVHLIVDTLGAISALGNSSAGSDFRIDTAPLKNSKCKSGPSVEARIVGSTWTQNSTGAGRARITLRKLKDGSLLVEIDLFVAQAAFIVIPMVASVRFWLRYESISGSTPNNAMQRSSRVVTPLAGTASGS